MFIHPRSNEIRYRAISDSLVRQPRWPPHNRYERPGRNPTPSPTFLASWRGSYGLAWKLWRPTDAVACDIPPHHLPQPQLAHERSASHGTPGEGARGIAGSSDLSPRDP